MTCFLFIFFFFCYPDLVHDKKHKKCFKISFRAVLPPSTGRFRNNKQSFSSFYGALHVISRAIIIIVEYKKTLINLITFVLPLL